MVAIYILGKGWPHNGSKGEEHMIIELAVIKTFEDYKQAKDHTQTVLHDGVLLSLHSENGKVLFGFISKVNIQELLNCFEENKNYD